MAMHTTRKMMIAGSTFTLVGALAVGYATLGDGHGRAGAAGASGHAVKVQHVDLANGKKTVFGTNGRIPVNDLLIEVYNESSIFKGNVCVTNALDGNPCFDVHSGTTEIRDFDVPTGQAAQVKGDPTSGSTVNLSTTLDDSRNDQQKHCYRFKGNWKLTLSEVTCDQVPNS